jgi:2-C-methyl-D-erythritol 2,4-cyclodiphosphate synthase
MTTPTTRSEEPDFRIGHGYDIHRTAENRRLVIGGVEIESPFGLDGHSDADCLTHAICDAILGAAGLPDIGHHFPNTDPAFEGADSQNLLRTVVEIVGRKGYSVVNVDATLVAESPRIGPHREAMKRTLAQSIGIEPDRIGIKATTNESVDDIGRGLAIAAHAVCLLSRHPQSE